MPPIVGTGFPEAVTVKLVGLDAVPPDVSTRSGPLDAAAGTVVVISVSLTTVNAAWVPLNRTSVAPVNPVPVTVTAVSIAPLVGLKPLMVGAGVGRRAALPTGVAMSAWTSA
jgi:hypothetical protein